uniref:Uncharacterized protein n=1 Tax=Eutreptiella gymnastica TaxID=73025 RepID=A0A7S4FR99_9EUGL
MLTNCSPRNREGVLRVEWVSDGRTTTVCSTNQFVRTSLLAHSVCRKNVPVDCLVAHTSALHHSSLPVAEAQLAVVFLGDSGQGKLAEPSYQKLLGIMDQSCPIPQLSHAEQT